MYTKFVLKQVCVQPSYMKVVCQDLYYTLKVVSSVNLPGSIRVMLGKVQPASLHLSWTVREGGGQRDLAAGDNDKNYWEGDMRKVILT